MITYRYPFLHDGLVRALLCDVGNHAGEAGVYWRYGAWVYDAQEGCIALLEQQTLDDHEGEISIRFQGTTSSALAQWFSQRLAERNRQFGYTHLRPTISGTLASPDLAMEHQDLIFNEQDEAVVEEGEADRGASKSFLPKLSAVPAETFHKSGREVFISYARGDQTPEGKERQRIVDEIIQALANHPQQINVRIDRDELRPGQLISAFMDRLAAADRVIVVISAKYLRSEYCMYELFKIYQNCRKQAEDFQRRIIPIVLPDARHSGRLAARLKLAAEWNQQLNELKPLFLDNPAVFGVSGYQEYLLIDEFARNSSDMLKYLHDQLQPRDYDRQIEEGFTELCEQILAE
jgi:internalin A